eukprot:5618743-Amphidinium_carterae.1
MGTWPSAFYSNHADAIIETLSLAPSTAVMLFLFQRHDTAFQLLRRSLPDLTPFVVSAGPLNRPSYRRI